MKILLLLLIPGLALAQNLSPEQQQKLMQDVQQLQQKVNALESRKSSSSGGGLKKINFENETMKGDQAAGAGGAGAQTPQMSPEQQKQIMDEVNKLKERQLENQKILDELDKED